MNTNRPIAAAAGEPGRSADRKAAVWIGVLYIIGTVALVFSGVVTGAVLTGPVYLAQVAAQPNQVAIGALLVLAPRAIGMASSWPPVTASAMLVAFALVLACYSVSLILLLLDKGVG